MLHLQKLRLQGLELGGKYRFVRALGEGGYAPVWLAVEMTPERKLLRDVAIKVFPAEANDREEVQRKVAQFSRETERTAKARRGPLFVDYFTYELFDIIVHPDGTAQTRESNGLRGDEEIEITLFLIVMEFADGGALGDEYRLANIVNAPDASYLNHFMDIATGLATLHEQEVVHRDIKPSNLLLFRKPNIVKIGDLGIATTLEPMPNRKIVGTPEYMSPEALQGVNGPARDRYALACTIFELLTGALPFKPSRSVLGSEPGSNEWIDAWRDVHQTAERPDAVTRAPTYVSLKLSGLLRRMMDSDPDKRPSNFEELIATLQDEKKFRFPATELKLGEIIPRPISHEPIQHSEYSINPVFRMEQLGEKPCVFFIDLAHGTEERQALLVAYAERIFGDTFSLCQVSGKHDFVIRVWTDPTRKLVEAFCDEITRTVLHDNRLALSVMPIDEVVYPGEKLVAGGVDVGEAKVRLNDAQLARSQANARLIDGAVKWLRKKGIFIRKRANSSSNTRIKAYTLVFPREALSLSEEQGMFARIVRRLEVLRSDKGITGVTAYRWQSGTLARVDGKKSPEHVRAPVLIKYVATHYIDLIKVPDAILHELDDLGVRTSTLLATKRLSIESDRIRPQ